MIVVNTAAGNTGKDIDIKIADQQYTVRAQSYLQVEGGHAVELLGTSFGPFGSNAVIFTYEDNRALAGTSPTQ